MTIAVPYENGMIFPHFGRTACFRVYEAENGVVTSAALVPAPGGGHGTLAQFLLASRVQVVLCGGIGGPAIAALQNSGIEVYPGVSGMADWAVQQYLSGKLVQQPGATCGHHHDHEHSDCSGHHGDGGCHCH